MPYDDDPCCDNCGESLYYRDCLCPPDQQYIEPEEEIEATEQQILDAEGQYERSFIWRE